MTAAHFRVPIPGIHHVTAIASDPQANFDFYARVLGLRLVKKTVNFDDPKTYHFYFGDARGRPGTLMTFFPWPGAHRGVAGAGQASATAFAVPRGALGYWAERLPRHGVDVDTAERADGEVLKLADPDGLRLELVERDDLGAWQSWTLGPVPGRQAIAGINGVTLAEADPEATAAFLTGQLGFRALDPAGSRLRFAAGDGGAGTRVDLVTAGASRGRIAAGSVHHVAFRLADDDAQSRWRDGLAAGGVAVTPVQDRCYFHSIYFREPGGVLFELATDPPGFGVDEAPEELGTGLRLPDFLEPSRPAIEGSLVPLDTAVPAAVAGVAHTVNDDELEHARRLAEAVG